METIRNQMFNIISKPIIINIFTMIYDILYYMSMYDIEIISIGCIIIRLIDAVHNFSSIKIIDYTAQCMEAYV